MAGTTGKRSRAASIQKHAIDQVNASLQELPEKPKDNLSLREAVSQLQDEIRAALAKGYSYEDLAAMFSEKGIDISALTLKRYVSSGRSRAGKTKATTPRTRRPRKAKETSTGAATEPTPVATAAKPGRRGGTTAAKTRSTKATTTAEPKKTTGRGSGRTTKASSSASAAKTSSPRSRKRTTK
jgi:hypothetical protein